MTEGDDDDGNKDKTNKQKWQPFITNLIDNSINGGNGNK
jgi:hypothetical protein